jgi:hypothetical protein
MREIAARLFEALENHLKLDAAAAAKALGYAGTSMLSNVRSGRALPDPARLKLLGELCTPTGRHVDLHWILTGEGAALRDGRVSPTVQEVRDRVAKRIAKADQETLSALLALLPKSGTH